MIRIRLSLTDLGRLRFALVPHAELVASAQALQRPPAGGLLDRWHRQARARVPAAAGPFTALVPSTGFVPGFLTPETCSSDAEVAEAIISTPRGRLRTELASLPPGRRTSAWVRRLSDGDREDLALVARAREVYDRACFAGHWPGLRRHLDSELAYRAHQLVNEGMGAMLSTLHPALRWEDDTLVVDVDTPEDQVFDLCERGLRIVPSVFVCRPALVTAGFETPTLVYPAMRPDTAALPAATGGGPDGLAVLLGETRAQVLRSLVAGGGTTTLAHVLGISPASVSEHVTALRQSGLAATRRRGRAVHHAATPLALSLLAAH